MWNPFPRDEREAAVDRAGDRLAYLVLSYGLLLIVAMRSFVDGAAPFELLALVIVGGVVGAAYRVWHRAFTRESAIVVGLTVLAALIVAAFVALAIRT
jgi:hypothetical protein